MDSDTLVKMFCRGSTFFNFFLLGPVSIHLIDSDSIITLLSTYASTGLTYDFVFAHLFVDFPFPNSNTHSMSAWQFYKVYNHLIEPVKYAAIHSSVHVSGRNRIQSLKSYRSNISLDDGDDQISLITSHANYVRTAFNNRIVVRSSFDVLG